MAAAAVACHFGADAQDLDGDVFALAPPAGYVATPSAAASPSRVALHLTKPTESGVTCEVSFEVLPEHFSQEILNRHTDNPDWEVFYREGLSDFYTIGVSSASIMQTRRAVLNSRQ